MKIIKNKQLIFEKKKSILKKSSCVLIIYKENPKNITKKVESIGN